MIEKIALSVQEAAAMIGVSRAKMYDIMRREDADFSLQIGSRRLVSRTKLEAWINRQAEMQHDGACYGGKV